MKARKFSSKKVILPASIQKAGFRHALLLFQGIDQSGPSYQARIFFNNPKANESTPMTSERGYAGKFHVFGNGRCWGDEGHCDVPETRREFDSRSPHPLTPRKAQVNVTDGLLKAVKDGPGLIITVVPVVNTAVDPKTVARCLKFEGLSLQIRSSHGLLEDPFLNP